MYFGGFNGLNSFFPDSIKDNDYIPPVYINEFFIFNKPVLVGGPNSPLQNLIERTKEIVLSWKQSVFSFGFVANNYTHPENNLYAYKMEGFDKDWNHTDANRRLATYTNLDPGTYTFRVKASNNDGIWNEQGTSVKITITPPFWRTWWFRGAMFVVLMTLAYTGYRLRIAGIKKYSRELEFKVANRTEQLLAANKELEAFAYSVSHDLRAPLRSIDGFSHTLLEDYEEKIDEQGKKYLHRIQSAVHRMAQLIEDMLNLSRISRSEMNVRQVNLSSLVQDIINEFRESQPGRNVEVIIQEDITVTGDERLLRVVLENLFGNAWKFTSKHQKSLIEFGMQRMDNKPVYFIRDDGAGFDSKYAQKLFGAFQRLHTTDDFPGTGIGLATVQRIIHRHSGNVWAEGEVEKGATFYFTLTLK